MCLRVRISVEKERNKSSLDKEQHSIDDDSNPADASKCRENCSSRNQCVIITNVAAVGEGRRKVVRCRCHSQIKPGLVGSTLFSSSLSPMQKQ